jgi:RNA polymerase sigma-70 factor (ECF subfamily)
VKPEKADSRPDIRTDSEAESSVKSPPAFEALFQEHWQKVFEVLYRLVGDPDEAQDLALEAFWRLYSRPPRDDRNLAGWLYRVASNLGLNALRAARRRMHHEGQTGRLESEFASPPNPASESERLEERRQVRLVLAQMDSRSARLLILRHSGLSYAELASVIGLSPASIGTLLARAERDFERRYRAMEGGKR